MQEHKQSRQPWDWRGQIIQLLLIVLVIAVAGGVSYLVAVVAAFLVSGGPLPVPDGWQKTVVYIATFAVFGGLAVTGMIRVTRYLRKNRGRLL